MTYLFRPLYLLLFCLVSSGFAEGDNPFSSEPSSPETTVSLQAQNTTIEPNTPFTVEVTLSFKPGWHAYYKNPGGPGLPLTFDWKLPEGFRVEKIDWPTPSLHTSHGTTFYIYENTQHFLAHISPPKTLQPTATYTLSVTPTWQLCNATGCQSPVSKEATLSLSPAPQGTTTRPLKKAKLPTLPLPLEDIPFSIVLSKNPDTLVFHITPTASDAPTLSKVTFISDEGLIESSRPQIFQKNSSGYQLEVPLTTPKSPQSLSGILLSSAGWKKNSTQQGALVNQLPLKEKSTSLKSSSAPPSKLFTILGGMFLGGLILNLMPCVFPVIGIKIMGFAQQAGEDKKKIVLHGLTFTSGILLSFGILSTFLLTLRNAALTHQGEASGWGFQLQNPYVVLTLLCLLFILALNMFGVFEIGASATSVGGKLQHKSGLIGSFFSGVLATVVATPCSAPFLGAAIGAAYTLPTLPFFLSFMTMGLGLGLPYLLLSLFPSLIKVLPRPGAWMESFKQGMSFLLFATAGYLLWIYAAQIGLENLLPVVLGLSLLAFSFWIYGRWSLPHLSTRTRLIARILTLIGILIALLWMAPPSKHKELTWETWSRAKVVDSLKEGRPVFVDFTATWCATCQVNKKTAYTQEVKNLFKKYNVLLLKGDKTSSNPPLDARLQELGRTAIPVNVLYVPGKEAIITPELLTPNYLIDLLNDQLGK